MAVAYALVAAVTVQLSDRHVRPLFDGAGPSTPYRWVTPPPEVAVTNDAPQSVEALVSIGAAGSTVTAAGTSDMQVLINLPAGAIPSRAGDDTASMRITPLDPASLGALPKGRAANGNAYRIEVEYEPSRQAVESFSAEGSVVLTVPHPDQPDIVTSVDGRTWQALSAQAVAGPSTLGAAFAAPGYYLGTTVPSHLGAASVGSGSGSGLVVVALGTAALVAGLWLLPAVLRRRRSVAATGGGPAGPASRAGKRRGGR